MTNAPIAAEVDALAVLEGAMGGMAFWHPKTLGQVSEDLVEAYIDSKLVGRPGQMQLLEEAKALRALPTWDRIVAVGRVISPMFVSPEENRRAIAWAAGLSLESADWRVGTTIQVRSPDCARTWFPDGLKIPGDWNLEGSAIQVLPKGLRVEGDLDLRGVAIREIPDDLFVGCTLKLLCPNLEELPRGLHVGGNLWLGPSPLAHFSDYEICQAALIEGRIWR